MPGPVTLTHRPQTSPADRVASDPVLCFRCEQFQVDREGDLCGRCGAEVDDWHWQAWAETHLEGPR